MLLRALVPALMLTVSTTTSIPLAPTAPTTPPTTAALAKWPPWISIEAPVNPFDASTRGAAFLIRAAVREGTPTIADISGTAEGLVNGVRKSVPLRIDTTSQRGVFAVRRQWPDDGRWVLRLNLLTTTAIVAIERDGRIGMTSIPTTTQSGMQIPRAVTAHDIDAMLGDASRR